MVFCFVFIFNWSLLQAQCELVCNGGVVVAIDANCSAEVLVQDLLQNFNTNTCVGPLSVALFDSQGNPVPTSPFVTGDQLGQTLTGVVTDATTGNNCSTNFLVADFLPPQITCPDINITCTSSTHPDDIGYPTVIDNCDPNPTLTYSDVINEMTCMSLTYTITRTWSATDASGNNAVDCVQTINVERPDLNDVQFPQNLDGIQGSALQCPNENTDPSNTGVPTINNQPILNTGTCELLVSYTDLGPSPICAGSYTILRTWTVTDECTNNATSEVQIIKVEDKVMPNLTCPADIVVSTGSSTACTALVTLPVATVSDDCSAPSEINQWIEGPDGLLLPNSTVLLPTGIYTFTYFAADDCGNTASCDLVVKVNDGVNPVAICNTFTTIALTSSEPTLVDALVFDDGSYDNCGPLTYEARRMDNPNCPGNDATTFATTVPVYCCDVGDTIQIEFRVTDATNQLSNSCMVFALVQDKLWPEITCPPDITLECTVDYTDLSQTGMATATDNCSIDTLFYVDTLNLNDCDVGTISRTWKTIDWQGLESVCVQEITLIDTTQAVYFFPPDVLDASCGDSDDPSVTGEASVEDDCGLFSVIYEDQILYFNDQCLRKVLRTWTIYDWCNGTSVSDLQVIKELDEDPPVFTNVPPDITVECDAIPAPMTPDAIDACDGAVPAVLSETTNPGICLNAFEIIRTWTATDNCGNQDSVSQTITVEDTTPPMITGIPADITVECNQIPAPITPTVTDNCDNSVLPVFTEVRMDGSCPSNYTLTRTWTATDDCGNQASASRIITVEDTTPPDFVSVPPDVTIECDEVTAPITLFATDNCDAFPVVTVNEVRTDGVCADAYTLTRTWTATDNCGNQGMAMQIVTVEDTTPPVFTNVPPDVTVDCSTIPVPEPPMATDNCDDLADLSFDEQTIGGICGLDATLQRTWTATDNCGNQNSVVQLITLLDNTPPTLSGVPADVTVECNNVPVPPTVTAMDNCDPDVPVTFDETSTPGNCPQEFILERTWMATDDCGNTASQSQMITVQDTNAPSLQGVPADITAECNAIPDPPVVTAIDDCDPNVSVTFSETTNNGNCPDALNIIRTWMATDACGNTVSDSQTITVDDAMAPMLSGVPADITVECDAIPDPPVVTATDNCDLNVVVDFSEMRTDGTCLYEYTLVRTWTATDACGNTVSDSQTITVDDTTAPMLSGVLADITVECDAIPDPPVVTATDNCDLNVVVDFSEMRTDGDLPLSLYHFSPHLDSYGCLWEYRFG